MFVHEWVKERRAKNQYEESICKQCKIRCEVISNGKGNMLCVVFLCLRYSCANLMSQIYSFNLIRLNVRVIYIYINYLSNGLDFITKVQLLCK
jgi:hypothetical protein